MNSAGTIQINNKLLTVLVLLTLVVFFIYALNKDSPNPFQNSLQKKTNAGALLCAAIATAEAGGREVKDVRMKGDAQLNEKVKGKTKEGVKDVLTDGDLRSHKIMYNTLAQSFPGVKVISEEHDDSSHGNSIVFNSRCSALDHQGEEVWIPSDELTIWIDPLDATKEYTENLLQYVTTMVCVAHKGEPIIGVIHNPFEKKTYWAWVNNIVAEEILEFNKLEIAEKESFIISLSHAGKAEAYIRSVFPRAKIQTAGGAGYKVLQVAGHKSGAYLHLTNIKKWDVCAGNAILNAIGGKILALDNTPISYDSSDPALIEGGLMASLSLDYYSELLNENKE